MSIIITVQTLQKLQPNILIVYTLQIAWMRFNDPHTTKYWSGIITRWSRLPTWQIISQSSIKSHAEHWRWIWDETNLRCNLCRPRGCIQHCQSQLTRSKKFPKYSKQIMKIIESLLVNRRFFRKVGSEIYEGLKNNNKKTGSRRGLCLPSCYLIFIPMTSHTLQTRRFISADDLCIASQSHSEKIEEKPLDALSVFSNYYRN